jgi:hypothetical protein
MANDTEKKEKERQRLIKQCINELDMHEHTLATLHDTTKHKRPKDDAEEKIKEAISDTRAKLAKLGVDDNELQRLRSATTRAVTEKQMTRIDEAASIQPLVATPVTVSDMVAPDFDVTIPKIANPVDFDVQYDVIDLPSHGEPYKGKKKSIAVAFMTAADENLITSPNLYKDGLLIDYLLKNKIVEEGFDADDLCAGDADAITLWLRVTAYGNEFPVTIKDPKSGEEFDCTIDLMNVKEKPFNLKADENGYFDYQITKEDGTTGDLIKFRFLTRRDERKLRKMDDYENESTRKIVIVRNLNEILSLLQDGESIDGMTNTERSEIVSKVTDWATKASKGITTGISKVITNRMEMQIVSVNGETDREFIRKYVANMPTRQALDFRRYVLMNEPSMDFEIEVERPESLGGGSFKTFLPWDDTIFYHIS